MKYSLALIMIIHGLIHLIGFFKKKQPDTLSAGSEISPIARTKNVTLVANESLVACLLFITASICYYIDKGWWLVIAIIAIALSQILIIFYWKDAKWGTIVNIIIIAGVVVGFAQRSFNNNVTSEVNLLFNGAKKDTSIVTKEMLTGFPVTVQAWLMNSGVVGRKRVETVRLKQKGSMRSKPGEDNWSSMSAEQYFTIGEPSFIWKANMEMMPGISIQARDKYADGKGEMKIKFLSLIPIANRSGSQIDQGTLQRWLAEICWFPTAALSPYIKWEPIDDESARATMTYRGVTGSAIFHFDAKGDITACTADRFMSSGSKMSLEKWEVKTIEYRELNGIRIPVKSEATWKLKTGNFTWLKVEVTEIEYNEPRLY